MWKKADVKQILHCHRNPKDLEDIPPPTLQSPQKMGEKEPLARIKAHSTTVNYLFVPMSKPCFSCFEVHLLEDNPVVDEESAGDVVLR